MLFNAQGLDFSVKDSSGDTPVHRAGNYCTDKTTCFYVFPDYVRRAAELGFDFGTRGHKGYTILHLSALNYYLCGYRGRITNVSTVLQILIDYQIPNLKSVLDTMSDSGATVLFYCINHFMFDEARELLQVGADPQLCGSPERNPVAQIDIYKEEIIAYRAELVSDDDQQQIGRLDERFNLLVEFESYLKLFIKPVEKSD